jgi:anti-sigma regulatory factor (Ser/Thr protein kinase)
MERFWRAVDNVPGCSPDHVWRLKFETAVGEIGTNIARHAYSHGKEGPMRLRLSLYADRVEACFTDWGLAFNDSSRPPEVVADDVFDVPEGGYGLAIARAALDRLDYRRTPRGTNSWRLVKRFYE